MLMLLYFAVLILEYFEKSMNVRGLLLIYAFQFISWTDQEGSFWIGASDLEENGHFQWLNADCNLYAVADWDNGQPNYGHDHCVAISNVWEPAVWHDAPCYSMVYSLCAYDL